MMIYKVLLLGEKEELVVIRVEILEEEVVLLVVIGKVCRNSDLEVK